MGARMKPAGALAAHLAVIIEYLPDVERDSSSIRSGGGGTPASVPSLPGGTGRISILAALHADVTFWALAVIDGRELSGSVGESTLDRARFLVRHEEWLSGVLGEEDLETFDKHARALRNLAAPQGKRRIPIGPCPLGDCMSQGGVVFGTVGDGTSLLVCDLDPEHVWTEGEYHDLAEMLGRGAPARMSIVEWVAWARERGERVTERQVRHWVSSRPLTIGWSEATSTLDRVATSDHWITVRARRASA